MRLSTVLAAAQLLAFSEAVWPQPQSISTGNSTLWITPDVQFTYTPLGGGGGEYPTYPPSGSRRRLRGRQTNGTSDDAELINRAFDRFRGTLQRSAFVPWRFYPKGTQYEPIEDYGAATIESVEVIQVESAPPTGNSSSSLRYADESYTLDVEEDGTTTIRAATANGAMHGLNTLVQLFYLTSEGERYYTTQAPVSVVDRPMYGHRGINMDISRNWQTPDQVKHLIDGLAFNKFSRLHIHATDSQSWPLEIPAFPDLARNGAYAPSLTWSPEELRDVQTYAYERGIESFIEIDSPGHTATIHESIPELITGYNLQPWGGGPGTPPYCNQPPCGQVRLNYDPVDRFFEDLYADLLPRVSPFSGIFHSGGDEVNANVYNFDPSVGSNDSAVIQPYLNRFMTNLHELVAAEGLTQMVWEEMVLEWNLTLPTSNTLVQSWLPGSLPEIVARGYPAIFSNYDYWYLDCGYGAWLDPNITNPNTPIVPPYTDYCSPQKSWRQVYAYDPRENITSEAELALIQGGEPAIWGELTDVVNLDSKVWPRASAAGEVMWHGPQGVAGVNETVTRRLADMRERMVGLGFQAQMVQVTWCLQNEGNCSL